MAETSFPVAGGASVVEHAYERLMAEISGSGFLGDPTATPVMYADGSGRNVKLAPDRAALLRGFRWETDSGGLTVPVAPNTSGLPRKDLGVLRLRRSDPDAWTVRFTLKQGSPASTPVPPVLTQSTAADGVWELPAGTATVASTTAAQADQGLPLIGAADVTPLDYYLGPQPMIAHSGRMPPVRPGQEVTQYDTGRILKVIGNKYHLIGESGPFTKLSVRPGWDNSNIYARRVNGFVYFQGLVYRNTPGKTTPVNTDVDIALIPEQFRPASGHSVFLTGSFTEYFARFYVSAAGMLSVVSYPQGNLHDNQWFVIHPVTWPAP